MGVAARACQPFERLGHKGGAVAVLFSDRLHHELEEAVLVSGLHRVVVFPVHLKLANRVFMVVLVGFPTKLQHIIADFGDHVIAAHHSLLVIAGLFGRIIGVGNLGAFGVEQEELRLDPGFDPQTFFGGFADQAFQDVARRLVDKLALHLGARCYPSHILFPRQLDGRGRIRHSHQVGMRGGQV